MGECSFLLVRRAFSQAKEQRRRNAKQKEPLKHAIMAILAGVKVGAVVVVNVRGPWGC